MHKFRHTISALLFVLFSLMAQGQVLVAPDKTGKIDTDFINGKACFQQEDYERARFYLLKSMENYPDNQETLHMLLTLEERTGHISTAIVHVNELLAYNPYSVSLWRKKISLYRLQGNDEEADRLLERISLIYPEDSVLRVQREGRLEEIYLAQGKKGDLRGQIETRLRMMDAADAVGAQDYLELANLYIKNGDMDGATDVINKALVKQPFNVSLIRRKAGLLMDQGKTAEAYVFVKSKNNRLHSEVLQTLLADIEDQILIESQLSDPYIVNGKLWESRKSHDALDFLISTSISRGYLDDAQYYLAEARKLDGDTPELLYKSYLVEKRLNNTGRAMTLLQKLHKLDPENQEVTDILAADALANAKEKISDLDYVGAKILLDSVIRMNPDEEILTSARFRLAACEDYFKEKETKRKLVEWDEAVARLYAQHKHQQVIAVADSALAVDPKMDMVMYYKGLSLEKLHRYDEAYECLRQYNPSALEFSAHRRHLNTLLSHKHRNVLVFDYQQARLAAEDALTANAFVEYTHKFKSRDELALGLKYTARDTQIIVVDPETGEGDVAHSEDGGVGLQLSVGYKHVFSDKFSATFSAAGAYKYFPLATARLSFDWSLPRDWTVNLRGSYRFLDSFYLTEWEVLAKKRSHMFNLGTGFDKDFGQVTLSSGIDAFLVGRNFYFNGNLKLKYYLMEHSRTNLFCAAGAGTAPEIEIIDNSLPVDFSHLNTFVSAGTLIGISHNLALTVSGSWYNLVNASNSNKNYFYINAQLQISF